VEHAACVTWIGATFLHGLRDLLLSGVCYSGVALLLAPRF
jgi:hypothetical protein